VYAELHRLARRHFAGEREGHLFAALRACELKPSYASFGDAPIEWANRAHFFGFSARLIAPNSD